MSEFSSFGVGGPIRYFLEIRSTEEALAAYEWARTRQIPVLVIGKGSNCLFSDAPFPGLVLLNKIDFCQIDGCEVFVGAGYSFSRLGVQTARSSLCGLEYAAGIPATVGGAIFMNAGASNEETSTTLTSVNYLFESGEIVRFSKSELSFSYRKSPFQALRGCILSARFLLQPDKRARAQQLQVLDQRMKSQPLKEKSAGCVFRNPLPDCSAGSLIDQAGLKGMQIGSAQVSPVHANFIINRGGAKAADILALIHCVQEKVFEQTGIHLELEIKVFS